MYDGTRRPEGEVATIEGGSGVIISEIDGRKAGRSRSELLPGAHAFVLDLDRNKYFHGSAHHIVSITPVRVCFVVAAGLDYSVYPKNVQESHWQVEVVQRTRVAGANAQAIRAQPCRD